MLIVASQINVSFMSFVYNMSGSKVNSYIVQRIMYMKKKAWVAVGIHVIKRISHGLWFDMIFIQLVMHFLSPHQGSGIENTELMI
jgi:hypothetical protein